MFTRQAKREVQLACLYATDQILVFALLQLFACDISVESWIEKSMYVCFVLAKIDEKHFHSSVVKQCKWTVSWVVCCC